MVPIEDLPIQRVHIIRDVASLEPDGFLVLGRCAEQLKEPVLRGDGNLEVVAPWTSKTGTFTRGMKLAGWVSGGELNLRPPAANAATLMRWSSATGIGPE